MSKCVLVTGGTGFVGANLVRFLLSSGHEVHLLLRSGFNPWRINDIQSHLRLHLADMTQCSELERIIGAIRPDWVFHLATHGAYSHQTDIQQITQTNINGTVNLVEACSKFGFEVFVNTGSSSEYGFKDHPAREDEFADPNSCYAVTKLSATLFCRYIAQQRKLHIPTLRLYSVFGPYEEPTRLFPTLIQHGLGGQWPPLVSPHIARDFVYVDDVIDAYLLAAIRPQPDFGAIYNVGTGIQTSLGELADIAKTVMQIKAEPQWQSMPNRNWDTTIWVADPTKIKTLLGWQPKFDIFSGLRTFVEWYQNSILKT